MGSTGGGHYISFAKHPATAKWYKFDDNRVEQISPEKLQEQQAYILFYTRRKSDRSNIQSISNIINNQQPHNNPQHVLLSRYWLHRVQAFSKPGPIDNLWLSCYHGLPLKPNHDRTKYCSIKIPYNTWLELTKKYGLQYNAKMLIYKDNNKEEEDIVMVDKPNDDNHDNIDNKKEENQTETMEDKLMKEPITNNAHYHPPWELTEKSDECEDCKMEQLIKRRDYEKQEIRRLEDDGCPQDCALNMKWANQWRNFVHNKTNEIPQRIDNRHIHAGNHALKDELIKDTDYLMIPSNIWTFLIEIYGGGPKIVPTKKQQQMQDNTQRHTHRPQKPNKQAPKQPNATKKHKSPTPHSHTSHSSASDKQ